MVLSFSLIFVNNYILKTIFITFLLSTKNNKLIKIILGVIQSLYIQLQIKEIPQNSLKTIIRNITIPPTQTNSSS